MPVIRSPTWPPSSWPWLRSAWDRRSGEAKRTFGYRRFELLAAFTNGILLILLTIWIVVEAILRFFQPIAILSDTMLFVALAGLVANGVSLYLLSRSDKSSLNMRAALLHVLGDALGSIGAAGAVLVIRFADWTPIDSILSLVLSVIILKSAWAITRQAAHILLEETPDHLERDDVLETVKSIPEVADAHHLHLWSLSNQSLVATLHIVPAEGVAAEDAILAVCARLQSNYEIGHATVEVERLGACGDEIAEQQDKSDLRS